MTTESWIILILLTSWLVLPAVLATYRRRRWRVWFVIGIFIPILTILILLLLPTIDTNRGKSAQKETKKQERKSKISKEAGKMKKSYTDDFKKEVAIAANDSGSTLASVGEQFGISPTLVRNWKIKFSKEADNPKKAETNKPKLSAKFIQSWIQNSIIEGTVDGDGDLYISLETSPDSITEEATKLFITGTQKLASGGKSEISEISVELTSNERNWLRSDFLKGVGSDDTQFSYNLNCDVYNCSDKVIVPIKLKKGKVSECPIKAGPLELSELNFFFEDGDFRAEGTITGPNGFIYAAGVLTAEPEDGHVPSANKTPDDENSTDMYEFLWDVKKGDTVYVVLCAFEKLDGKLSCGFTGEAQVEEPVLYDDVADYDTHDVEAPEVDDIETKEGDIGLFEFQIKRGEINLDEIEDIDEDGTLSELVEQIQNLCDENEHDKAAKLLLDNLSFEFDPSQLDDEPERFFASTDWIEFECTNENTSVRVGWEGELVVTISVQFEIPLKAGISTADLAEYLPDSGAWGAAFASPGWGYTGSDGENVWFLGLKGQDDQARTENLENGNEMDAFLKASELQTVLEGLESIENKLYERGKLVTLTGDSESEVSIVYEWTGNYDDSDDEEGPWLIIRINAEDPKTPSESVAEEICDYVRDKVMDFLNALESSEDVEALKNVFGEQVILNGRKIY